MHAERERHAAYLALTTIRPADNTPLRRRLLQLSAQVWWHPFWGTRYGRMPAARIALRRFARVPKQSRAA
ncbi:hypothetical protein ABT126_43890 [Streptomyces sp. NPDC002012]|uniref:hypothetical protein n=1 Tax=Streptomyces sp. NPDC002012 TaxID=3154532 RepID=UPI0033292DA4